MIRIRHLLIPFATVLLTGCGSFFLYPTRDDYFPDFAKYLVVKEGFFPSTDGEQLHYWFVPAQNNKKLIKKPKGLIIQIHGNAQNLTSHMRSMGWLTEAGYNLAVFDYRGYGKSTGSANLDGVFTDVLYAFDYLTKELNPDQLPVCFYGQSLGGTLMLKAVSSNPGRWKPSLLVVESSFYSYRDIAMEKMAEHWLSWAIQWIPHFSMNNKYSLDAEELKSLAGIPKLLFYSENDPIVPLHHGRKIYDNLPAPKEIYTVPERGHINTMWVQDGKMRDVLVAALNNMKKPLEEKSH